MTLNITIPNNINDTKPRISVIGIGGAGGNAVNTMINSNVENIEFIVANTDGQALSNSLTKRQIQLGKNVTSGLGAGSNAETGRKAAEESIEEIISELGDINMLFITTGMGGGTGSGAAPVIAKAAKEKGILTVAVVTKPFDFEGQKRMKVAENGLAELKGNVDTLIIIPNQNLFKIANEKTTFAEAFKMADDVLYQGICGITDLITNPGMINLDFADIRTVMGNMGKAMMGTGESSGDERAKNAAEAALNNPLLDDNNIKGAKSILLNIKGGPDMALFEVDEAASKIRNEVDENANIIFGSSIDESLEGIIRVSVVATGINNEAIELETDKNVNKENFDNYQLPKNNFNIKDVKENTILEETNINEEIKSELLHNIQSEQSDLEVQIKNLNKNKDINLNFETNNKEKKYGNTSLTSMDNVELEMLIDKKPTNSFTEKKPKNILKRLSTFFNNNKIEEQKVEPNIANSKFDSINQNKKSIEDLTYDEIQNIELKSEKSEDLFNQYKNNDISKHQINLIDIEQNKEGIDENILEIPAFLRRQAN
ncbi:cell division protein FtsZ [Alphaproteobacteria bacterium]|nr:cell division protein FtsZ [Alphaproteobacteria bacterium]